MHTSSLLLDPRDEWIELGQTLRDDELDLDDAFEPLSRTGTDGARALETWGCRACGRLNLAVVTWTPVPGGRRFDGAESFRVGDDVRRLTHVTHRALEELAGRPDYEALLAALRRSESGELA